MGCCAAMQPGGGGPGGCTGRGGAGVVEGRAARHLRCAAAGVMTISLREQVIGVAEEWYWQGPCMVRVD